MHVTRYFRRCLEIGLPFIAIGWASWTIAHHSFAVFDDKKSVSINGTVKSFRYTNPHIWIELDVPNEQGGVDEWGIESAPPSQLRSQGWSPTILKPGDKLVAVLHPRRDGTKVGSVVSLNFDDGTPVGKPRGGGPPPSGQAARGQAARGGQQDRAPTALKQPPHPLLAELVPQLRFGYYRQRSDAVTRPTVAPASADPKMIAGRYSPIEATLLLPGDKDRMLPYTDAGASTFLPRARDFLSGTLRAEPLSLCKPGGAVRALNQGFTAQVMQSADEILFVHMEDHLVRRIHLNASFPARIAPTAMGYSIGHWEGDTLIVESRAFSDGGWIDEYGDPGSRQLQMVERITKQPDASLRFEITMTDPTYYSEPVTFTRNWTWTPNVTWDEMICEENNHDAPVKK